MKRTPFIAALLAAFLVASAGAFAQATETVLYTFTGGVDGGWPSAGVAFDGQGNLYGTTRNFGPHGFGVAFQLRPSGGVWSSRVIHGFCIDYPACHDGANPLAALTVDTAGDLYGVTSFGGSPQSWGTAFRLARSGGTWTETVLRNFSGQLGDSYPAAGLTMDDAGNLFGTAEGNPVAGGFGDVFELAPNPHGGWNHRILYNFKGGVDGRAPRTVLVLDKNHNLYGMTGSGGRHDSGVVFELKQRPNGTWVETVILDLPQKFGPTVGGLILDVAGNLYGTANGRVFELSPVGSRWIETVLYDFGANEGGRLSRLVFDDSGNLYGTAGDGGRPGCENGFGCGSVFKLTRTQSGWVKSTLYLFSGREDGGDPVDGVVFDRVGNLYGATTYGGEKNSQCFIGCGVVYRLTP